MRSQSRPAWSRSPSPAALADDEPDPRRPPPTRQRRRPRPRPRQPFPKDRACYLLGVEEAVAPTADLPPVDCSEKHTSITFAVGRLDNIADGHLLAVDSQRVQDLVATACPQKFAEFAGGSTEAQRLSMLRAVWFTPTVEESDAGAEWFRCDAIAVAGDDQLAPLRGRLDRRTRHPRRARTLRHVRHHRARRPGASNG